VELVRERAGFVHELWDQSSFFFVAPAGYAEADVKKRWKADSANQMFQLSELLETLGDFTAAATEEVIKAWIQEKGYGMGAVMNAFRLCIVGASKGPHMFDIIEMIGKEETISRLKRAIATL